MSFSEAEYAGATKAATEGILIKHFLKGLGELELKLISRSSRQRGHVSLPKDAVSIKKG